MATKKVKEETRKVLKDIFGYDEFRPMQEEIICNLIDGKDAFVLMPTAVVNRSVIRSRLSCVKVRVLLFHH